MSRSGNEFIASTEGTQFTLYSMCKMLGIPLSKEQEEFQAHLERRYPPHVEHTSKPSMSQPHIGQSSDKEE